MNFFISIIFWLILGLHIPDPVFPENAERNHMIAEVNKIRSNGCFCGRRYMPPAGEVKWNETLYKSALHHAKEMEEFQFFNHFSKEGKNIGDRIEMHGYVWDVVGENLGEGQEDFDEVLRDWKRSYTHCIMLMNPKVDEMAVARYGKYWVQHFGKQTAVTKK